MTVGIGLVCRNGVLVASDGMGSTPFVASRSVKVHAFANNPVVWTAAGSVYVMEEVEAELLSKVDTADNSGPLKVFSTANEPEIRSRLKSFMHPAMKKCNQSALGDVAPPPPGQMIVRFPTDFLMLGWGDGKPWFLEFASDGQVNSHTASGFYAVGSGGPFASVCHGLMKHYITDDIDLAEGKLLAHRAITTTCEVSPGGVGLGVQIAVVDDAGQRVLDDDEIETIGIEVQRWKTLEADTLRMTHESAEGSAVKDLPSLEE